MRVAAREEREMSDAVRVTMRVIVGIILLIVVSGIWACLWVPPLPFP